MSMRGYNVVGENAQGATRRVFVVASTLDMARALLETAPRFSGFQLTEIVEHDGQPVKLQDAKGKLFVLEFPTHEQGVYCFYEG